MIPALLLSISRMMYSKFEKLIWLNTLSALLKRGGPRTEIFEELTHWVRAIGQALRAGKISQEDIAEIRAYWMKIF